MSELNLGSNHGLDPHLCAIHYSHNGKYCLQKGAHHFVWDADGNQTVVCVDHFFTAARYSPILIHDLQPCCGLPGSRVDWAANTCVDLLTDIDDLINSEAKDLAMSGGNYDC